MQSTIHHRWNINLSFPESSRRTPKYWKRAFLKMPSEFQGGGKKYHSTFPTVLSFLLFRNFIRTVGCPLFGFPPRHTAARPRPVPGRKELFGLTPRPPVVLREHPPRSRVVHSGPRAERYNAHARRTRDSTSTHNDTLPCGASLHAVLTTARRRACACTGPCTVSRRRRRWRCTSRGATPCESCA